jgi:hypothetical protein
MTRTPEPKKGSWRQSAMGPFVRVDVMLNEQTALSRLSKRGRHHAKMRMQIMNEERQTTFYNDLMATVGLAPKDAGGTLNFTGPTDPI